MDVETLVKAGIRFSYCRAAMFPQIPYVQDVLFVLQLSPKKDERGYYSPASVNWEEYIMNLMLLAAAVAPKVLVSVEDYDEDVARKIIARAIMDLCPDEAKCLFETAYIEARKIAGEAIPPEGMSREQLLKRCPCPLCELTRLHDGFDDEYLHEYLHEVCTTSGAAEVCDGLDNDCDSVVDDGPITCEG